MIRMSEFKINRRNFIRKSVLTSAACLPLTGLVKCWNQDAARRIFLLRYDVEWWGDWKEMDGFFDKVIEVHHSMEIPVTFFCKGQTLEENNEVFGQFYNEVKDNPLYDFQDHSYSHIGLGYSKGKPVDVLKADYEKSFNIHEEIFGKRPIGISMCGTRDDGPPVEGFDSTDKSKAEFEMVAKLGVNMINHFLTGIDGSAQFGNFSRLGHPEIMGFPSAYSDTAWMLRREFGDPVDYILSQIKKRSELNQHMPLMFHDWVAWQHAPDKELTHLKTFIDYARKQGYLLLTHSECLKRQYLWKS